jgi:hypothetical protein
LSLRDTGSLTLGLQEVTLKDPAYKMPPGRFRTHTTLTLTKADFTPQGGLAGALLEIARDVPDGLMGEIQAGGRLVSRSGRCPATTGPRPPCPATTTSSPLTSPTTYCPGAADDHHVLDIIDATELAETPS